MNGIMRLFILAVIGGLFSGYAAASDEAEAGYLAQVVEYNQNIVAASCRASLPSNPDTKSYYNVDGLLLEAHDYCMYLAIEYVRRHMRNMLAPAPQIYIAEGASSEPLSNAIADAGDAGVGTIAEE